MWVQAGQPVRSKNSTICREALRKMDKGNKPEKKVIRSETATGAGIAIGIGIGVAIGGFIDNLAFGIAIGVAIGAAFSGAIIAINDRKK